jgi:hypothetical protein
MRQGIPFQKLVPLNKHVHHNSVILDCSGYRVQNKIMNSVDTGNGTKLIQNNLTFTA